MPVTNLVGNENEGWTYAKYLLGHERAGIAGTDIIVNGLANLKPCMIICRKRRETAIKQTRLPERHAELSVRGGLQMLENRALFAEEARATA